jgi:hypothetical protein
MPTALPVIVQIKQLAHDLLRWPSSETALRISSLADDARADWTHLAPYLDEVGFAARRLLADGQRHDPAFKGLGRAVGMLETVAALQARKVAEADGPAPAATVLGATAV